MTDSEKITAIKQIIETRHFNNFNVAMDSLSDIIHIVYGIPKEKSSQDGQNWNSGMIVDRKIKIKKCTYE